MSSLAPVARCAPAFVATFDHQARARRLRALLDDHRPFVGRVLRNLGVSAPDLDDCLQQVFVTASQKLDSIVPEHERGFLVQTAVYVASRLRRARAQAREVATGKLRE